MRAELLLIGLGSTAEQVAETLKYSGATGVQGSGEFCPIANYMSYYSNGRATAGLDTLYLDGVIFNLPSAVSEFIRRFDGGEFGELKL